MKKHLLILLLGIFISAALFPMNGSCRVAIPIEYTHSSILQYIHQLCIENNVSFEVVAAMISVESQWNPTCKNRNNNGTTDYGFLQINSRYATEFTIMYSKPGERLHPLTNPGDNLTIGIRYFADLYRYFQNYPKAIMAYNCGLDRVVKNTIPASTRNHLARVASLVDPQILHQSRIYVYKLRSSKSYNKLYNVSNRLVLTN